MTTRSVVTSVSRLWAAVLRLPRPLSVAAITLVAASIVIAYRVDAFTMPQFYAEDGAHWFSDAYNLGALHAIGISLAGYLQVVSRLGPVIAAPFGIANQPLIYNICGLLIQVAPVCYFLSSRFDTVVPSFWVRVVLSAVYLLMPAEELNVDITSAPFHLAILATLVIIAPAPARWYWKAFDLIAVLLCGFSGPFVYILLPASVLWYLVRRKPFTLLLVAALAVALGVQFYASRLSPRPDVSLSASLQNLVLIVCDRIILAGIVAEPSHSHIYLAGHHHGVLLAGLICLLAIPVAVFAAMRAPWELRLFALVSLGIVIGGLLSPLVSLAGNQWFVMATSGAADRYFLMARVAWVVTLMWAASRLPRIWMRRSAWAA
ncbi:MAG: hypothetical protein ACHQ4F_15200, partial [Candidatus Dormibacteria bacterium]